MEEMIKSPFDLFAGLQETYEEAVKKNAEESRSFARTKHFRMDSPGTYSVRILPLAPIQKDDGSYVMERKGYEYPVRTQVLKLENPNAKDNKSKIVYSSVTHSSYAGISVDLIDTYLEVAEEKYGDDEKLMKKIKGSGFEGGLKWGSQRAMYIIDTKKRGEGIQLLSLSYSQYKDLEERKLSVWKKLMENNPKAPCPISSITSAYPVEIVRKEENKKTSYTFNVDVISGAQSLSEEEVNALLEAPRLPELLYRYSRYQLEATIEFLRQYDEKNEMDVMGSKKIADAIDKIKMELPADDKSHFSFDKKDRKGDDGNGGNDSGEVTIDTLWSRWEALKERGIGDKSDEGQELRDDIRSFIDENGLSVRVVRGKTNEDLLGDIDDALENAKAEDKGGKVKEEEPETDVPEPEDEPEDNEADEPEEEEAEEEPETESRRTARPMRRRVR